FLPKHVLLFRLSPLGPRRLLLLHASPSSRPPPPPTVSPTFPKLAPPPPPTPPRPPSLKPSRAARIRHRPPAYSPARPPRTDPAPRSPPSPSASSAHAPPSPPVDASRGGEEMAAAAAAACRRGLFLHNHHHQWPTRWAGPAAARSISQLVKTNGRRAFLVDTLALVRKLESQGVPTKQAEAITSAITEVLNDSLESISESFVSKAEMQKSEMLQEANISKFKSQVQSSQENHFSLLQRETEKLRGDIDKMRSELKYEIDKVTAGQRLDLNLERG
uniref:Uncharacterized protein n=1 Tax=Aegilops tauschii subsp. strangulata TaxID=200361 RepID=A0A453SFD3_AEGTS